MNVDELADLIDAAGRGSEDQQASVRRLVVEVLGGSFRGLGDGPAGVPDALARALVRNSHWLGVDVPGDSGTTDSTSAPSDDASS